MEVREAIGRVLLGEPLRSIAVAHREEVLRSLGMDSDEVSPRDLWEDTGRFMNRLCRELGERHSGDQRAGVALADWAKRVEDYDAYDATNSSVTQAGPQPGQAVAVEAFGLG